MKLLKKFIQVCKEFKQICTQDKSQIMNFFILQALMFLAMLISIFLGINEMLQDGSMNKIFVGEEARVQAYFRNLTTIFWIVGAFLASIFYAMYRIVEKHR